MQGGRVRGMMSFYLESFEFCHLRGAFATRNLYNFRYFKISPFGRNDIIDSFSKLSRYPIFICEVIRQAGISIPTRATDWRISLWKKSMNSLKSQTGSV